MSLIKLATSHCCILFRDKDRRLRNSGPLDSNSGLIRRFTSSRSSSERFMSPTIVRSCDMGRVLSVPCTSIFLICESWKWGLIRRVLRNWGIWLSLILMYEYKFCLERSLHDEHTRAHAQSVLAMDPPLRYVWISNLYSAPS